MYFRTLICWQFTCWMLKHVETFTGHQTDSSSPEAVLWHRWLKAAPQRARHCGSITTQRTQQIFCQTCGKRWFCADVSSVLAALTWKEYDVSSAWTFKKPWNVGPAATKKKHVTFDGTKTGFEVAEIAASTRRWSWEPGRDSHHCHLASLVERDRMDLCF